MLLYVVVCFAVVFAQDASGLFFRGGFRQVYEWKVPEEEPPLHPVEYTSGYVNTSGINVFYRSAVSPTTEEPKMPVLLLHAARYTSKTWKDLGTLRVLATAGYQAIAVDLPGYGKTKKRYKGNKSDFLLELIQDLGIERPVLVSPSMSGVYSIPFVLEHSDELRGYVAIAPTNKGGTSQKFSHVHLPALIIYGSWDGYGKLIGRKIAHIPGSKLVPIYWGTHHCYVEFPGIWHKLLEDFLAEIYVEEQAALEMEIRAKEQAALEMEIKATEQAAFKMEIKATKQAALKMESKA